MKKEYHVSKKVTALLVYLRPFLVSAGMLCAIGVMWNRSPILYTLGVLFLFISMSFDLVDGWFSARFSPNPLLAQLADRIMDKIVYSIVFPLVGVGEMWRLMFVEAPHARTELLHAIFVLFLCVTVLVRDDFAHFMRSFAIRKGQDPEHVEFTRLRTMVAAPVGALLFAHAFYVPEGPPSHLYFFISWLGNLPLNGLYLIEILFLSINFGSIAIYCRKYGKYCLDDLCLGDPYLRRRILAFFPNALTVMNAIMGILSVFFAYQGRVREAYLILMGAAFFDKLDGMVARKLGLTEPLPQQIKSNHVTLGSIMDDISDAISFCIVPGWIYYIVCSTAPDPLIQRLPIGWIAAAYIFAGMARLVYFTLDKDPIPGFFKGMPTPAAALLVTAPLIMLQHAMPDATAAIRFWGVFSAALMVLAALMMNFYPVHYLHLGRYMSRKPWFSRLTLVLTVVAVFTPYFGHFALCYMFLYVLSPAVTWRVDPRKAALESRSPR